MPKNYAYYNLNTGFIENTVFIDPKDVDSLVWPDGFSVVEIPDGHHGEWSMCGVDWSYIDGKFVEPPKPPEPEPVLLAQSSSQGAQTL